MKSRFTQSTIRNLERGICPQAELDALRKVNPELAAIAEKQNELARAEIAKLKGE